MQKINLKRKAIIFSAAIFILAAGIFVSNKHQNRALASPASTIYLDPATDTVDQGQTFNLDAKINPSSNEVTAVVVHVTFDHTKFQLNSITPQSPPATCSSSSTALSTVLQSASINNNAGTASITVGVCLATPPAPITSNATVATFAFQALTSSVSSSPIAFTSETVAAALNESGDVITTRTPAAITVNGTQVTYGISDFAQLVADWLQTKTSTADVNDDGKVDSQDLGIMMGSWQE